MRVKGISRRLGFVALVGAALILVIYLVLGERGGRDAELSLSASQPAPAPASGPGLATSGAPRVAAPTGEEGSEAPVERAPAEDALPIEPIRGRCVDERGEPVPGAVVSAHRGAHVARWYADDVLQQTVTDARGDFVLDSGTWGQRAGDVSLTAWHVERALGTTARRTISVPRTESVLVELGAMPIVSGRVEGMAGTETADIRVRISSDHLPEHPSARVTTVDDSGHFAVVACRPYVHVQATAPGRLPSSTVFVRLTDGDAEPVTLTLGGEGRRARIRIVDETGTAVPRGTQALVGVQGALLTPASVGAEGLIELKDVDGAEPLRVSVPTQRSAHGGPWLLGTYGDVHAGELLADPPWTLVLARGIDVEARLTDAMGRPLADAPLSLFAGTEAEAASGRAESAAIGTTDATGSVRLSSEYAMKPGEYVLAYRSGRPVLWSGTLTPEPRRIEVAWAGPDRVLLEFDLVGADGRLVEHANISLRAWRRSEGIGRSYSEAIGQADVAQDGRARLLAVHTEGDDLSRVSVGVSLGSKPIAKSDYDLVWAPVGLRSRLQLHPDLFGGLLLTVRQGEVPLEGALAVLRNDAGHTISGTARSDGHGVIRFGVVPIGSWRVEVRTDRKSTFLRAPVEIPADTTTALVVDLRDAR